MKAVPKTELMRSYGEDYWNTQTHVIIGYYQEYKNSNNFKDLRLFNHSMSDVHTVQMTYGCELEDDGTNRGYYEFGYDGDDFIRFDKNTLTWTAGETYPQAVIIKNQWEADRDQAEKMKANLENPCIWWLKDFASHMNIQRDAPEVSLLQKNSSSPVICHATSFYPKNIMMTWKKNNEDHNEDVEVSETLPNADGTFQKSISLSVKSEEWKKNPDVYRCVIQHVGAEKEIVVTLNENNIKSNTASDNFIVKCLVSITVAVVVGCVLAFTVFAVKKRLIVCRKCREFKRSNATDSMRDSTAEIDIEMTDEPQHVKSKLLCFF
ncbi:H-2 class I histocompatibility antigen, alpha chain-like [Triplophysa dalaica]|uniref:H-2 class I histocompatibility antigen, alpha chain-like n=1 Tax=Triplophysa dalaica TaxID=1582913 RepID=UPI0024DFF00A|nr:H-2 class I histocompatibility antigen, alpha chain-like [Triplophysa dalaica]XP_056597165.1 H-2 class I histocompatibility antigen, alpha chain-like [Triplophysa dalaica]XP_056597166.1 H-2 class I histocompatibility antigen, alpha chain-like [Triplophysa dalaica]